MSHGSSPAHPYSGEFKSFYDPEFTADISTKMQVPDRISVVPGEDGDLEPRKDNEDLIKSEKLMMHVPERILVAGGEHHIEGREPLPELKLETSLVPQSNSGLHLVTPPRSLTLDSYHYPSVEPLRKSVESIRKPVRQSQSAVFSHVENGLGLSSSSSDAAVSSKPEEEVDVLRRQVKNLNRRVLAIERETQQRQQREIVMYSIIIGYFLVKSLAWLHRHW